MTMHLGPSTSDCLQPARRFTWAVHDNEKSSTPGRSPVPHHIAPPLMYAAKTGLAIDDLLLVVLVVQILHLQSLSGNI